MLKKNEKRGTIKRHININPLLNIKIGVRNMAVTTGLEWTFDTAAATYEKLRPGYVEKLYQTIFAYIPINASKKVVEVGIGSGQATLPVLQTGCEFTAVEYGKNFSKLCTEKFKAYPNFSVVTNKFENVDFETDAYDLVFSATAFHWVPEEIGYKKVYSMLKSGGAFARFANHPYRDKENPALTAEMDKLYGLYYDTYYHKKQEPLKEYGEKQAKQRAMIAKNYGFEDICYSLFYRTRTFSAKEYIQLLGTYSDHIAMEETVRTEFFDKIQQAIDTHGGRITIYDTIDLQLARKP